MITVNGKITVRVNRDQKNEFLIGGVRVASALKYENNHREKQPVIAEVVDGNEYIRTGQIICSHHNHYSENSPYYLYDDLYNIPFSKTIFGVFDSQGNLSPTCGNMICEMIDVETTLPLPPSQRQQHIHRYKILDAGWTKYKPNQIIFTRPYSGYVIVYVWDGEERRVVKVDSEMVCGILQ